MTGETRHIIIGLPASGKTTYLAALWHLVEAQEAECRLVLDKVTGDVTYLNAIAEAWRSFKPLARTSQVGDTDVMMLVHDHRSGKRAALNFPDLAGESFDTQVERRRCRQKYISRYNDDQGILLFITANKKEDALTVIELNRRLPPVNEENHVELSTSGAPAPEAPEWTPALIPAQVRLVQMLGDLLDVPFRQVSRKIAVIISAWDLVPTPRPTPLEWLKREMPLVEQFLSTNQGAYLSRIYGISAQGVSLENQGLVTAAALKAPSYRIMVDGPDTTPHDLTAPILWLMSGA